MKFLPERKKTTEKLRQIYRPTAAVNRTPLSAVSKAALQVRIHSTRCSRLLEVMQKTKAGAFAYNAEDLFNLFIQFIYCESMMHQGDFMSCRAERGGGASLSSKRHCRSL